MRVMCQHSVESVVKIMVITVLPHNLQRLNVYSLIELAFELIELVL
jgi:hypothetical protein